MIKKFIHTHTHISKFMFVCCCCRFVCFSECPHTEYKKTRGERARQFYMHGWVMLSFHGTPTYSLFVYINFYCNSLLLILCSFWPHTIACDCLLLLLYTCLCATLITFKMNSTISQQSVLACSTFYTMATRLPPPLIAPNEHFCG
jgi:hypothetical protein